MTDLTNYALREHSYQVSMAVSALMEGMGMFSENIKQPGKWTKSDFDSLIEKYQLSHNQIVSNWMEIFQ